MVLGGLMVNIWFVVWLGSISLPRSTLNTVLEIASSDILVEYSAVSTLESVLLAILMAEVVDLKNKMSSKLSSVTTVTTSPHNLPHHLRSADQGVACCGSQSWCMSWTQG